MECKCQHRGRPICWSCVIDNLKVKLTSNRFNHRITYSAIIAANWLCAEFNNWVCDACINVLTGRPRDIWLTDGSFTRVRTAETILNNESSKVFFIIPHTWGMVKYLQDIAYEIPLCHDKYHSVLNVLNFQHEFENWSSYCDYVSKYTKKF